METESDACELIQEIMSLQRERGDLLRSLTPTLSRWEQIHGGEGKFQATTKRRSEDMASASQSNSPQQIADLLNCIVGDVEDLGHRMLSMAYVLNKSGGASASSSYKANELFSRISRLRRISEEFYNDTKNNNYNIKQEDEERQHGERGDFLFLCRKYLQFPDNFKNELVLNLTEEEKIKKEKEKKEKENEKEEEKKLKKEEEDVSTMEFLKRMMDFHNKGFAEYRACWERVWGSETGRCGGFQDTS